MSNKRFRILLLCGIPSFANTLRIGLEAENEVDIASTFSEAVTLMEGPRGNYDVVMMGFCVIEKADAKIMERFNDLAGSRLIEDFDGRAEKAREVLDRINRKLAKIRAVLATEESGLELGRFSRALEKAKLDLAN